MSVFFAFLAQISDRRVLTDPGEAAGRVSAIPGVGNSGNLKCRVTKVRTRLVHLANVGFFAILTLTDERRLETAKCGAAGRFLDICGIEDAEIRNVA